MAVSASQPTVLRHPPRRQGVWPIGIRPRLVHAARCMLHVGACCVLHVVWCRDAILRVIHRHWADAFWRRGTARHPLQRPRKPAPAKARARESPRTRKPAHAYPERSGQALLLSGRRRWAGSELAARGRRPPLPPVHPAQGPECGSVRSSLHRPRLLSRPDVHSASHSALLTGAR